jgi:hypothetical protein
MLFSVQTIEPMCHLNGKESSEVSGTKIPIIKNIENYFRNSFCLFNAVIVRFYDFWKECPYIQKLILHALYSSFYHMSMFGAKETSGREFLSDELFGWPLARNYRTYPKSLGTLPVHIPGNCRI